MRHRGIVYDVGTEFPNGRSTRTDFDPAVVRREIGIIGDDLHCTAVRVCGHDPARLGEAAGYALEQGLAVWFSPLLIDATQDETLRYLAECSRVAEELRRQYPGIVFVVGNELSFYMKGILPGEDVHSRIGSFISVRGQLRHLLSGRRWPGGALNAFLSRAVATVRSEFGGSITYGSGPWERADWRLFDIVGVNYYRDAGNAKTYRKGLARYYAHGKPVAVTEFGCCTYEGADDRGAVGWAIIDTSRERRSVRDGFARSEGTQSRYLSELLTLFMEEPIDAAFVFQFARLQPPHLRRPRVRPRHGELRNRQSAPRRETRLALSGDALGAETLVSDRRRSLLRVIRRCASLRLPGGQSTSGEAVGSGRITDATAGGGPGPIRGSRPPSPSPIPFCTCRPDLYGAFVSGGVILMAETITDKTVCVVGLGYVGLPLAEAFAAHLRTIGFRRDQKKVDEPNGTPGNRIEATTDPSKIREADFVIIAVPTPVTRSKDPDFEPVVSASQTVGENLKPGAIVVLESTVYPGASEEFMIPALEAASGLVCGKDFFIGYSPERINPGDEAHDLPHIFKIVAGQDEATTDALCDLYGLVTNVYRAPDIRTAEAAKVIENVQRDLNIALMNELSMLFARLGLDTNEVLEGRGHEVELPRVPPRARRRPLHPRRPLLPRAAGQAGPAAGRAVLDAAVHALVVGDFDAAAGVVAHRHPAPAAPADRQALQQRGAFAGGAGGAIGAVRGGIAQQQLLVGLVLVPADVAGVGVADQRDPLLARHELVASSCRWRRGVRGGGRRRTRRRSGGCAGCAAPASAAAASRPARPCGAPVRTRTGNSSPSALNCCTVARAEPVRANRVNRCRMACCTPVSGSSTTLPAGS